MKNKWFTILTLVLAFFTVTPTALADEQSESNTEEPPTGFIYEVIKPENQHSDASYFDLRMQPGQKQTVTIRLKNVGTKEQEFSVKLNGAKTSSNGVINYGPNKIENDASLKFDFADIVKGPETVTIAAGAEADLNLDITMPEESYAGMISGGIQLQSLNDAGQKQGMIVNKFAYIIGMVLTENDAPVASDLQLNKVYAGLSNHRNAIFVDFSNTQPKYMEEMTTAVSIMSEHNDEVIYERKHTGMRMAPNSKIDFPVSLNGEAMEPGDYRAHILVTSGNEKWEWTEGFTITEAEAEEYNQKDVGLIQDRKLDWKMIAIIAIVLIVVIILLYLFIRKMSQKKVAKKKPTADE